jgi:hypothetical protein
MDKGKQPNRKSIRKRGWDYTATACYFITINTYEGKPLFGNVVNGSMVLSDAGRIAEEEWRKSAIIRDNVELDEFVVMPNHVHGIVRLKGLGAPSPSAPSPSAPSPSAPNPFRQFGKPIAGALGTFVGAYKAAVTRQIRRGVVRQAPTWHRNYWDVIVRDERALIAIREYIRQNPQNYEVLMKAEDPQSMGNRALLEIPKMGFLASRGADTVHGHLPLKAGEAIVSGFLSPMERAVFKAALKQKRPLIWVKPWRLDGDDLSRPVRQALDEGRLLMLSPFHDIDTPSARRAAWCNQYVLAHCDRVIIGHLNPGGMLACILSEGAWCTKPLRCR